MFFVRTYLTVSLLSWCYCFVSFLCFVVVVLLLLLYLGWVGQLQFQLQLPQVLVAVWVAPHSWGGQYGPAGVRVDAPALPPLAVQRHLALKKNIIKKCKITIELCHMSKLSSVGLNRCKFDDIKLGVFVLANLFEVILPPLVAVGDVKGIQVLQGASVISEGHLGYPLQDLVQLLLTLGLDREGEGWPQCQVWERSWGLLCIFFFFSYCLSWQSGIKSSGANKPCSLAQVYSRCCNFFLVSIR